MLVHAVTALRWHVATDRITHVLWGMVDGAPPAWALDPHEAPMRDVVMALEIGELVYALFPNERDFAARLRLVKNGCGMRSIDFFYIRDERGRTIRHMPGF